MITRKNMLQIKGVAICGMVMLHLFCRKVELPYSPWIYIGNTPLVYYLGLLGDMCVPIFCFCSGYAHCSICEAYERKFWRYSWRKAGRLLLNYWLILIMVCIFSLCLGGGSFYPESVKSFLGNLFLIKITYNGAWWFLIIYLFFLLLLPLSYKFLKNIPSCIVIIICSGVYCLSYILRFKVILNIDNKVMYWLVQQMILWGTSQLGYYIGMLFRKKQWLNCWNNLINVEIPIKRYIRRTVLCIMVLIVLFIHCIIESLALAPITAIFMILFMCMIPFPKIVLKALEFLGLHSTNIWLIHMFWYLPPLDKYFFKLKYPILIVVEMLVLCILSSKFIMQLNNIVTNWLLKIKILSN